MEVTASWRLIKHDIDELPTLILRSDITDDGYTVYLSDLEHIWTEDISKEGLVERAHELGCNIDPGEDVEQYHILTKKIEEALQQKPSTTLQFSSPRSGTNLTLLLTAPLPKPLPKLEWEVHLQRRDDGLVRSELTGPLLHHANALQQQITHLVGELHAKDHVLSRLTDRLEASGTPLGEIFPNVSNAGAGGRYRPPSREKLAQHVRGLAAFDEKSWRSQATKEASFVMDKLATEVLPQLIPGRGANEGHKASWWRNLDVKIDSHGVNEQPTSSQVETDTLQDLPMPPEDVSTDDDEFQLDLHSTPAKPKASMPQPDIAGSRASVSPSKKPKKLGAIGGRPAARKIEEQESLPQPPDTPNGPRSRHGVTGDKEAASTDLRSSPPLEASPVPAQSKIKKLGVIGGRKTGNANGSQPTSSQPVGPVSAAKRSTPEVVLPVESEVLEIAEEDKPDYRREQLKRQQEQMKHTPKKKRKF